MSQAKFYIYLLIISLLNLLICYALSPDEQLKTYYVGMLSLIFFFIAFCTTIYILASKTSKSKDIYLFSRIFIASILFKMLLLVLVVIILIKKFELKPDHLVYPLLLIYLSFTTLETYTLIKISKQNT